MKQNNEKENKDEFKKDNYKGKRQGRKFKKVDGDEIPKENNYLFYAASEQIAKDLASLPFNVIGGKRVPITAMDFPQDDDTPREYATNRQATPGVCTIQYSNSVGSATKRTDGVNMAATQLYTKIRQANSGAKNYESADVMMYVLAIRDILGEYFQNKKILGIVNLYNYYNHNLPDLVIRSMGIDPVDLRANIAQYRGALNLIAKKINSFAIPKYFKMFDRAAYINSYLFMDSDSIRAQIYSFNKVGWYVWSGRTSESGSELQFSIRTAESREGKPFSQRLGTLTSMLDALFLDEDVLTMNGDILKAFGEGDLYKVGETPDGYTVECVHDTDILGQIHNSHPVLELGLETFGGSYETDLNVTQEGQLISFNPYFYMSNAYADHNDTNKKLRTMTALVLNSSKANPDYRDVLEWTRLMSIVQGGMYDRDNNRYVMQIITSGLEIVWGYQAFFYNGPNVNFISFGSNVTDAHVLSIISQFDWHPLLYPYTTTVQKQEIDVLGDIKVATVVDQNTLERINEAAVYGAVYSAGLYNGSK